MGTQPHAHILHGACYASLFSVLWKKNTNIVSFRYVFCRQRQDERLRRGAEQKSVVVLSEHPFSSVLGPLSQHLGPLFFNDGVGALQAVYDEISHWPPPAYEYRGVLAAGTLSLTVSLPPPATLPPPCLFDMLDDDGHVPGLRHVPGQTMLGVFHEACTNCSDLCDGGMLYVPAVK